MKKYESDFSSLSREELVARLKKYQAEVYIDSLTELSNRRAFEKAIEREMSRVKRGMGEPLSLALLDIDHFKSVNDEYGHTVGDELLRKIGAILRIGVRSTDFVGRYGGEEFVIIMPATVSWGALRHAEVVRALVKKNLLLQISHKGETMIVSRTVSVGVATWDYQNNETMEAFIKRVDAALYRAKAAGRDRVVLG